MPLFPHNKHRINQHYQPIPFQLKNEAEKATKVQLPKSNTIIIWTPIVEWYVVRCGSKNWCQKDMCLKEIGLRAQDILTILGSLVNMIEEII